MALTLYKIVTQAQISGKQTHKTSIMLYLPSIAAILPCWLMFCFFSSVHETSPLEKINQKKQIRSLPTNHPDNRHGGGKV